MNSKKIIALIPARSGSKGLPNKNILELNGKPLIQYTIEAAKSCKWISKVVVSTDSEEYANISKKALAEVPFLRPSDIAQDSSSLIDVIKHMVEYYKNQGESFDLLVLLQPTSPLRNAQHLNEALEKYLSMASKGNETLVSVVAAPDKSRWLMAREDEKVKFCFEVNVKNPQRQKLDKLYLPNGAIYVANIANIEAGFFSEDTFMYEMDENHSVDIDTIEDFRKVESLIKSSSN